VGWCAYHDSALHKGYSCPAVPPFGGIARACELRLALAEWAAALSLLLASIASPPRLAHPTLLLHVARDQCFGRVARRRRACRARRPAQQSPALDERDVVPRRQARRREGRLRRRQAGAEVERRPRGQGAVADGGVRSRRRRRAVALRRGRSVRAQHRRPRHARIQCVPLSLLSLSTSEPRADDLHPAFRSWTLLTVFVLVFSGVNAFFSLRYPSLTIGYVVALVLAHPCGKAWAALVPNWRIGFGRASFRLNPGPWTIKEHALVALVSSPDPLRSLEVRMSRR